jgi:hypothetical protein
VCPEKVDQRKKQVVVPTRRPWWLPHTANASLQNRRGQCQFRRCIGQVVRRLLLPAPAPARRPRSASLSAFKSKPPPPPRLPTVPKPSNRSNPKSPQAQWKTRPRRHRRIPSPRPPRRAKRRTRLLLLFRRRRGGCCGCAARCSTTTGAAAGALPSSRASLASRTRTRRAPTPSSGWARTPRRPRRSSTTASSSATGSRGTPTRLAPPSPRGGEATSHSSSRYFRYKLTNGSVLPCFRSFRLRAVSSTG